MSASVDRAVSFDVSRGISIESQLGFHDASRNGRELAAISSGWEILTLNERMLPSEFAAIIRNSSAIYDIEHIQPDFVLQLASVDHILDSVVSEEFIAPQENLRRPPLASSVTVAVIDTGIDHNHPSLSNHILPGWNFPNNTSVTYDASQPLASAHGTHITGIIAGTASAAGVNVQILPLQVFADGKAYTSDIIAAIEYAAIRGAGIVNVSFGSTQENPALKEAIASVDALFVCAVGNHRRNFIEQPSYPAGFNLPNIISVASVNADGGLSFFSNYGLNIDIAALGRDVWSTFPENEYGPLTGTSMSAAYVTAVAAILSANEGLSVSELKERLTATGDRLSNLQNKVNEGRRVNVTNAINNIRPTNITENHPEDDFTVHGLQMSDDEAWELFNSGGIVQVVSAGTNFSLALRSDGTVWSWGSGGSGRLGHGTGSTSNIGVPGRVASLTNVTSISAGTSHALALRSDGTVWAWGNGGSGRLGNNATANQHSPVQVHGLTNVIAISAGGTHSLALRSNGSVWAWGSGTSGRLGRGSTANSHVPVQVSGMASGVTSISAGDGHSLVIRNGAAYAWGFGGSGRLGNGTRFIHSTANALLPVRVTGMYSGVIDVAAGGSHSLALRSDGTVWSWGNGSTGRLGDGYTGSTNISFPVRVSVATGMTTSGVTAVEAGANHSFAIRNGELWAWGGNGSGRLGIGSTTTQFAPVRVSGMASGVTRVSAGGDHSMAVRNSAAWNWGNNASRELGDGTTTNRHTPIQVGIPAPPVPVTGVSLNRSATTITAGSTETLIATVSPANATNRAVTWSSSNPAVATVNATGVVTAVSAGTATITVTTVDGNRTASCTVTVIPQTIAVTGVSLNISNTTITVGGTETLVATVNPANATNRAVTWSSSNPAVATVNATGIVTAVSAGMATITVTTVDGGRTASATVTVVPQTIAVTGVSLNRSATTITAGSTETLIATVSPANATNRAVTWSSSNPAVATVNATGVVTAVSAGTATITVTTVDGNRTASAAVSVNDEDDEYDAHKILRQLPVVDFGLSGVTLGSYVTDQHGIKWYAVRPLKSSFYHIWMPCDENHRIGVYTSDEISWEDGYYVIFDASATEQGSFLLKAGVTYYIGVSPTDIWSSSNPAVATVNANGVVTAASVGTATITVTTVDGGFEAYCVVTVTPQPILVSGVSLDTTSATITVGRTEKLNATVYPANATNHSVTWRTSDESIATVNADGVVTALAAGVAVIV